MTEYVQALLNQLKDKSYKKYRVMTDRTPILYPVDFFGFHIGNTKRFEKDDGGNITPNYKRIISKGFDKIRREIVYSISNTNCTHKKEYGNLMLEKLDECIKICDNFRKKAITNPRLYNALSTVPHKKATTFYEACVFLKICIYCAIFYCFI